MARTRLSAAACAWVKNDAPAFGTTIAFPARRLDGLHVLVVARGPASLTVTVEPAPQMMGCPGCGVIVQVHSRREVLLIDAPAFATPTTVVSPKRRWVCLEPFPVGVFTEQDSQIVRPRWLLTVRACRWAVQQLRFEHASVQGIARRLGTSWRTV